MIDEFIFEFEGEVCDTSVCCTLYVKLPHDDEAELLFIEPCSVQLQNGSSTMFEWRDLNDTESANWRSVLNKEVWGKHSNPALLDRIESEVAEHVEA